MKKNRHLFLVTEKAELLEGPITRLDLWYRFQPIPKKQWIVFVVSKLLLLGTLFYVVYGK